MAALSRSARQGCASMSWRSILSRWPQTADTLLTRLWRYCRGPTRSELSQEKMLRTCSVCCRAIMSMSATYPCAQEYSMTGSMSASRGTHTAACSLSPQGERFRTGGLYAVRTETGVRLGELDEEFVFEARVGDKFLLGAFAWQIADIGKDTVVVSQTSPARSAAALLEGRYQGPQHSNRNRLRRNPAKAHQSGPDRFDAAGIGRARAR